MIVLEFCTNVDEIFLSEIKHRQMKKFHRKAKRFIL